MILLTWQLKQPINWPRNTIKKNKQEKKTGT